MNSKINLKPYIIVIIIFLALNYLIYILFDIETTVKIVQIVGNEDGIIEYMTFFSFLIATFLFIGAFLRRKNIFFLLLAIVFFMGAGEEISWGQRIFSFSTPESLNKINVQNEFNIHNIGIFNTYDPVKGGKKSGMAKLVTIGFLYKLFWLGYCIVLPLVVMSSNKILSFVKKIHLPIPPFSIGIFFFIGWLFYRIVVKFFFEPGQPILYYLTVGEMEESVSAFIFMILGIYFYNKEKKSIMELK